MSEPFFTIITVCLNAGEDLIDTLNSILIQDFKNFNVIVKDGLSVDNSIDRIPNSDNILLISEKDNGIYSAMNQALAFAKGEYILFLNAGDCFNDHTVLSKYYEEIENNNFPELVYCDYSTTKFNQYVNSPIKITPFFLFRTMLCHQVCMFKRSCFVEYGCFDLNYIVDADYEFLVRTVMQHKIRTKHFRKLGVISKSDGFSAQNNKIAIVEVDLIRKRYFGRRYYPFMFLLKLTFPNARIELAKRNNFIYRIYQQIVNFFNNF